MKANVVGTGHLGLVIGACMAEVGNSARCLALGAEKIRIMPDGGIPTHEPGLQEVVNWYVTSGRLHLTTSLKKSVQQGTIKFIAADPLSDDDGCADLKFLLAAARSIGRLIKDQ